MLLDISHIIYLLVVSLTVKASYSRERVKRWVSLAKEQDAGNSERHDLRNKVWDQEQD